MITTRAERNPASCNIFVTICLCFIHSYIYMSQGPAVAAPIVVGATSIGSLLLLPLLLLLPQLLLCMLRKPRWSRCDGRGTRIHTLRYRFGCTALRRRN